MLVFDIVLSAHRHLGMTSALSKQAIGHPYKAKFQVSSTNASMCLAHHSCSLYNL